MRVEGAHFFTFLKRDERGRAVIWSDADRIALSLGNSGYNRAAALATRDYRFQAVGAKQDMRIVEYHKEILPGIGYMKFWPGCAWLAQTDRRTWNLWLKREGGADYTKMLREKPEDFFQWPVPEILLSGFRAIAARIAEYNDFKLRGRRPVKPLLK